LISVIIPVLNEESNVEPAYRRIADVFRSLQDRYQLEIIFTDNHSTDRTFERIEEIAQRDGCVCGVRFSRNFGFSRSVLTGYRLARGSAAIQVDCDLQDPPEALPEFLKEWEKGHDLVVGVRIDHADGTAMHWARRAFYRALNRLTEDNLIPDSGDFRLVDRSILDQLQRINDAAPYVRGLTSVLASNQVAVPYRRAKREAGDSKFPLRRLIGFAVDGLLAHSTVPLRFAAYVGLTLAVLTFGLSLAYILVWLFSTTSWPRGFATTTVLLLFGISINAIFLGIIGEYLGRIYNQIRLRPTTVVERSVNLTPASAHASARPGVLRVFEGHEVVDTRNSS